MTQELPAPHPYAPFQAGEFRWSMGLAPLDLDDWIEVDRFSSSDLAQKERLLRERPAAVFAALPAGGAGSAESLALLAEHLPRRFPQFYRREGHVLRHLPSGRQWRIGDSTLHPLDLAARMIQEDLCLMQRDPHDGAYRLVAASVCFPTGWVLAEKMGRSVAEIHAPVPRYEAQLGSTMDRFFDRIKTQRPVWRLNWNLMSDPALFMPRGHIRRESLAGLSADNAGSRIWLRVERQTLRRLPSSQDVLFTIRVYVRSLREVAAQRDEAERLAAAIEAVPEDVRRYKGLQRVAGPVLEWLARSRTER